MSGRKSWEVASVLDEVEKIFDKIVDGYQKEIMSNIDFISNLESESKDIENKIEELDDKELREELSNFRSWFNDAKNIKYEVKDVFNNIEKYKKRAKELRVKIANSSHYMDKEYAEANNIKTHLNRSKDKLLNLKNSSLELKNKAKKLNAVLENIKNLYEAKRNFLNERLQDIEKRFNKKEFVKLEDFVENKHIKVSKCEYFEHYTGEKVIDDIKKDLKRAKEFLDNKKFKNTERLLEQIDEKLNKIFANADKLKEDIESSFALTLKIRDLMIEEINFREAEVELIDNNPANGFRLTCKNGDTLIFDEIKVANGEVKVELNHIEKVNGSCKVRWAEMKKILNKNGIPLVDVKKDGKSIFDKSRFKDKRIDKREKER